MTRKIANFELSTQNSPNFHFLSYFPAKHARLELKKVQRSYVSWQWRVVQSLNKNWLVVWSKKFNFMDFFYLKGKLFETKAFTVRSRCDTEGPWKVSAKTRSWFPNQPKKIGEFLSSRQEGSNFQILMVCLV